MPPRLAVPSLMAMEYGQPGRLLCVSRNLFKALQKLLRRSRGQSCSYAEEPVFYVSGHDFFIFHLDLGHSVCQGHSCTTGFLSPKALLKSKPPGA